MFYIKLFLKLGDVVLYVAIEFYLILMKNKIVLYIYYTFNRRFVCPLRADEFGLRYKKTNSSN